MPGIDETDICAAENRGAHRSDTRELDDDNRAQLVERIWAAGHVLAERAIVKDDVK